MDASLKSHTRVDLCLYVERAIIKIYSVALRDIFSQIRSSTFVS